MNISIMSKIIFRKLPAVLLLFLTTHLQASIACSCDSVADSLQLVNLRTSTNGDNWTNPWDLNTPMSTWFGVTLTPEGCVEQLDLYVNFSAYIGNNLTGSLPALQLPSLKELVLQGNNLTGTLPDFSGLPALERLNLNANSINGTMPDFAANPALRIVAMDTNPIAGSIPDFPGSPELVTLSCYFCALTGNIPDFSAVPQLQNIYLGRNFLEGNLPDFQNLPNLRTINLTVNNLDGDIFDFSNTPLLEELLIGSNNFTGNIPDYQNVPLLQTLELSGNDISGMIPDFSGLPNMENLKIGFNPLTGNIPNFSGLPVLQVLDVSRAGMTGNLPDFSGSPQLEKLSVIGNELTGAVPDYSAMPLVTLRLQENNFSDLPDLSALNDWGDFVSNGFVVNDNELTFEDILPNMSASNSGFWKYAPQDSVGETRTEVLVPGSDYIIDLENDEDISDNVYDWFKDGLFYQQIIGDNGLPFIGLTGADEGTYTCVITNDGASALTLYSRPVTLVLCVQATDATAGNSGAYCTGETIELFGDIDASAAADVSYAWTGPEGYTSSLQNPTDASVAGQYTFVATLDGCPSIPVTTEVEVFATPSQPTVTAMNTTLCAGESLQLNTPAANDVLYQWTGPVGFMSGAQNPLVSSAASPQMSGVYSLNLNNNGCLSPAGTIEINVLPVADASFTLEDICEGESAVPTGVATDGGTFAFVTAPSDAAVIDAATGEVSNTTAGLSYTVIYSLNENGDCPSSATQTFTVTEEPGIENITTECAPNLLTYTVFFTTTGTDTQISASAGTPVNLSANNWAIEDIPADTDIIITAGAGSALQCTVTTEVSAPACECPVIPAPAALADPVEICEEEENAALAVTVAADFTVNWYDAAVGGSLLSAETLVFTPDAAGTYYAETFDPLTQCVSEQRTAIVYTIYDIPVIEVGEVICDTVNNSYTLAFYSDSDEISLSEGDLTVLPDNNYLAKNVRDVSDLLITADNGLCIAEEIFPAPDCYCRRIADFTVTNPVCFGSTDGSILVNPGSAYGSAVTITLNGETVRENVNLPTVLTGLSEGDYLLEINDADGCLKVENLKISQPEEPILNLGGAAEITVGDSVELDIFTNVDYVKFEWLTGEESLSCTDCLTPTAAPLETTFYRLRLTNADGCTAEDVYRVFVKTEIPIFAPTAFSPNDDGVNDYFMLFGEAEKVVNITELQVFDRWGNQVFAGFDLAINEENAGWDGIFRGQRMKNDVYVWFAEAEYFDGRKKVLKGSVSLLR